MRAYKLDENQLTWASETQKQYFEAVREHGSIRAASRALGVAYSTINGCMKALERRAAVGGYAPEFGLNTPQPSPFSIKGTSTLYDEAGEKKLQWVKTKVNDEQSEAIIREFVEHLVKDAKGLSKHVSPPKYSNDDLLAVYPLGDPHFGLYAWAAEAGEDFDTSTAESVTKGAIDRLVNSAPPAGTAIVLPLGDLLHADDTSNATPRNKNALDIDTRWAKVMMASLKALKHAIYRALEKHQRVIVRVVGGNHDPHSSYAIAMCLAEYFDNNERVTVDLSPSLFWYYRFGKVLLGSTHGDKAKGADLLGVMASDRAEDWGETKFRYWYCGHIHHVLKREYPGVVVEAFRTLAAADAWTAGMGYRTGRDMYCIVHHRDYGEIERHRCDITMLRPETAREDAETH